MNERGVSRVVQVEKYQEETPVIREGYNNNNSIKFRNNKNNTG
jgi:hypothetical protein